MINRNDDNSGNDLDKIAALMANLQAGMEDIQREIEVMHDENQRTAATVNRIRLALDSVKTDQTAMSARFERVEKSVLKSDD